MGTVAYLSDTPEMRAIRRWMDRHPVPHMPRFESEELQQEQQQSTSREELPEQREQAQ